jgi:glycolate dehydrogenase FAD-linked subunit
VSIPPAFAEELHQKIGPPYVRDDRETLVQYAADALGIGAPPDLVVFPGSTQDVSTLSRLCHEHRIPLVVRGAGTGYTGGAVPTHGGVVLSMARLNRILEIDETNLLAIVEPNVVTADLQRAVEAVGLFYPPDPASLETSSIGGNVAECAGGPRAFKYGTTKRYVLALEAVLPGGEVVHTGSKAVKNVVGYDLTQLLVGSEGTLAVITKITLRLIPKPPARATLAAPFRSIRDAVNAVTALLHERVVPAAIELIDDDSLRAAERYAGKAVAQGQALLIVRVLPVGPCR